MNHLLCNLINKYGDRLVIQMILTKFEQNARVTFRTVCVLFVLFLLFVVVLSSEPKQNEGRPQTVSSSIVILLPAVRRWLFCVGSVMV